MRIRTLVPTGGTLPDSVWRGRHRAILVVLWAHVPGLFTFALIRGYPWNHAVLDASIVASPALLAQIGLARGRREFSTITASVGLMVCSAVLVHLSGGVIEAHFHFFVMVGVVVLYQEWTPYLVSVAFVVGHHAIMGTLYPHDVYDHSSAWNGPLKWAVIHGVGILAMSAAGIANWRINEKQLADLAELNGMLEATLESTSDGILAVANDGRITTWNSRYKEILRIPEALLRGRDHTAVVAYMREHVIEPDAFGARMAELTASPASEGVDVLTFHDGRVIERTSRPQRLGGITVGRVWSFHDATDQTRLRHELATALDAAIEVSRTKSEFLATVSHEIRTPMNGIIGLTELLHDTSLDETQLDYVDGVRLSGQALLAIVNDILDFAKLEAGKLELESTEFDAHSAIGDVALLVAQPALVKGLQVVVRPCGCGPVRLRGDVGRLRQILLNLVNNAVKFTESGSVTVRCSTTPTSADSAIEWVTLHVEVRDTGIGIGPADLERLFQPFTQVDSSNTRRFGGTGLGLAISSRLAADMGGTISVTSQVGVGSTFSVDIPFAVASEPPRRTAPTTDRPTAPAENVEAPRRSLLIVEDNVVNQLLVKAMAGHLGYRCDIAANGTEALALLEMRPYDAVVMDCFMPEMDGFTATAELRRREGGARHTPVIAVTVAARDEERARCFAAGMDDYLVKPINEPELAWVLSQWVDAQPAGASS